MSAENRAKLKSKYRSRLVKYLKSVNDPDCDRVAKLRKLHSSGLDWFNAHETALPEDNVEEDLLYLCQTGIPSHYKLITGEVKRLVQMGLTPGTFQPSPMAYAEIQRRVARFKPELASETRQRFIDENLPVYGFDNSAPPCPVEKLPGTVINIYNAPKYQNNGHVGAMGDSASYGQM